MEIGEKKGTNDVILQISSTEEAMIRKEDEGSNSHLKVEIHTSPDNEIISNSNEEKSPMILTRSLLSRRSLTRSTFSKPKSRFAEPLDPVDSKLPYATPQLVSYRNSPTNQSIDFKPAAVLTSTPQTPRTLLIGTPRVDEEEDEEVYKTAILKVSERSSRKFKSMVLIEWIVMVCVICCLIASLTINKLQKSMIWGLELWKWFVLVLVTFSGRLFTEWLMNVLVYLVERNFLFKKKVLYFVYGMKRSVQVFVWLGLVLLTWVLLFKNGVARPSETQRILNYITRAIGGCLIGAAIWLVKTLFVKMLASSFHVMRFFDRIQESIFHQYVLRTLSGPPLMEMAEQIASKHSGQLSFQNLGNENDKGLQEVIDVEKLKKMKQEKVSAWTMKALVNVISGSNLSTIADTLDIADNDENNQKDNEINCEWEAKAAAYQIFNNVAKPGYKYIEEEDLLRFMKKSEVDIVFPLFERGAETRNIKRSALKNWLVNIYVERKSLAHSLNDTKTAIKELNRLISGIVLVVILIVWLLMMGFLTTQILLFISSQLLVLIFVFGNTAKTLFEAIIFVFVMHPFDVGDRCVIDGVQMTVEEMNILTTVFLRYDGEKIFYPNSVLSTKPVSNFYRSPEMGDSIDFCVDVSTSMEQIGEMKARIKKYIESKPQHWRPGHGVSVKEIEDMNKMKMSLGISHTINFQNSGDKSSRRSDLLLELKAIFEDVGIKYHLLPQEVHVSYVQPPASAFPSR